MSSATPRAIRSGALALWLRVVEALTRGFRRAAWLPERFAGLRVPSAVLVLLAVATQLFGNELNRLVDEVLSSSGHVYSLSDLNGWGAATQIGSWAAWSTASANPGPYLVGNAVGNLVFLVCYAVLAGRIIRAGIAYWMRLNPSVPIQDARTTIASNLLLLLALTDLAEDVLLLIMGSRLAAHPAGVPIDFGAVPYVLACFTYAKLAALALLAGYFVLSNRVGARVRSFLALALRMLYAQRLVALVVAVVAVMCLLPLPNLFEQASDAYRGLIDYSGPWIRPIPIDPRLLSTIAADIITGLVLYAVGRERARHYATRQTKTDDRADANLWWWLLAAVVVASVGVGFGLAFGWSLIDPVPFFMMIAAILFITLSSAVLRALRVPLLEQFGQPILASRAREVRVTGDLLVASWVAVCFFAPFKALVTPLFLSATGAFASNPGYDNSFWFLLVAEVVLLVAGIALAVFVWRDLGIQPAGRTIRDTLGPIALTDDARARLVTVNAVMLGISLGVLVLSLAFPSLAGVALGPVGALVLLLGCWCAVLGTLIRVMGNRKPLEIFALLRVRSTPIVTLLVAVPFVVSMLDSVPQLHAVRFGATASASSAATTRLPIAEAFAKWETAQDTAECAAPLDDSAGATVNVRPLVLVAAQGGGIRAATWIVDVLDQMPTTNVCAENATFLSSGASGGSIGLTTLHTATNSTELPTTVSTEAYAGQEALGSDIVGLLDGDLVGAMSGMRMPSASSLLDLANPSTWTWHDRTGLQELAWEREQPSSFDRPFDTTVAHPTGYLVLNSTDSVTSCKVVVSQLDLGATPGTALPDCNGSGATLSNTIDLAEVLGRCVWNLHWSTAAELSARFPVVSPPGRIDDQTLPANCRRDIAPMQLVDGGTTDNSAIGTLSDIAPTLAGLVSRSNAASDGSPSKPFIVPVILYASNDPGLDLTATANRIKPDALVPLSILKDAHAAEVAPAAWLTRAASSYSKVCDAYAATHPGEENRCQSAVTALRKQIPAGVVVASPSTSPAVSVPLGWTLSGFSQAQLLLQARQQADCGQAEAADATATCRTYEGYGTYGSLLTIFEKEQ